jgi:hypothetical protein
MLTRRPELTLLALTLVTLGAACTNNQVGPGPGGTQRPSPRNPGQTSFTSEDQNGPGSGGKSTRGGGPAPAADNAGSGGAGGTGATPPTAPGAPAGRVGDVQEGDIYKVAGTRL